MCAVALAPPKLSQTTHPERPDRAAARELEQALLIRYHRTGDLAAREELTMAGGFVVFESIATRCTRLDASSLA